MKRVTVFASGSGSNFQALIDANRLSKLNCSIAGLIAGSPDIGAIAKADTAGIPHAVLRKQDFPSRDTFVAELQKTLRTWETDWIVLAGYIRKLPDEIIAAYRGRIINIHPSLLPKFGGKGFYGLFVHEAVLAAREQETGCTVHFVDEIFDHGAVIAQRRVPVFPEDTAASLQARVLKEEHELLPLTLQNLLQRES